MTALPMCRAIKVGQAPLDEGLRYAELREPKGGAS